MRLDVIISNLADDELVYRESQRLQFGNRLQLGFASSVNVTRCIFPAARAFTSSMLLAEGQLVVTRRR